MEVGEKKGNEETAAVSYPQFTFPEHPVERGRGQGKEGFFGHKVAAVTLQAKENWKEKEKPN